MSSHGEKPLSADEMRKFKQLIDPSGRGRLSAKEFRALACWEIGGKPYSATGPIGLGGGKSEGDGGGRG
jgi:hypothetical protein